MQMHPKLTKEDARETGIYVIKNTMSGKMYVGSAVCIRRRWSDHRRQLRNNKHANKRLQNAWNKYGEGKFTFFVQEAVAEKANLLMREQFWIDHFDAAKRGGYNIRPTAGSSLGNIVSVETRRKLSAMSKGRKHSPEARARISEVQLGKVITPECRAKIGAYHKGRPKTEECKKKLSAAHTGKTMSPEARAKMSIAKLGKKLSAEHCAKLSTVRTGRVFSLETRAKIAEKIKAAWARKRASRKISAEASNAAK